MKNKGTILYVGGFELPDKNAAAHRVMSNAKIFKELGFEVVLIGVIKSKFGSIKLTKNEKEIQGFKSWSVEYPKAISEWLKYLTGITLIKGVLSEYSDVKAIVAYNYPAVALYRLIQYSRKRDIIIISDITEWYEPKRKDILKNLIIKIDSLIRMKVLNMKVDGLILVSKFLMKYYSKRKSVVYIPPLVDLNEDKWKQSNANSEIGTKLQLIYSGSPGKEKDKIDKIIANLITLQDKSRYELKIVGITEEEYLSYYPMHKNLLKKAKGCITFLGRVSHSKSIELLKMADFSILYREDNIVTRAGFPTKVVESITAGIPIICNESSNLKDYIVNGYNGYIIDDWNYESFERILSLKHEEVQKMKRNINKNNFDYHNYIKSMDCFMRQMKE